MQKKYRIPAKALIASCGLIGALAFLLIYGLVPLDPTNDLWLLGGYDEGDIVQHYAGWLAFRNSPWAFPLGYASGASIPDGLIISYTDSVPWVAILCKLFRGILPSTWQYFGLYTFVCFVLQGIAAGLLLNRFSDSRAFTFGSCILFVSAPILLDRALRHTALASHWLILFSIYVYLVYREKLTLLANGDAQELQEKRRLSLFPWQCFLLNVLAIGLHPYLMSITMLFTLLCCLEYACRAVWESKPLRWCKAAGLMLAVLLTTAFAGWCLGVVGWSSGDSREGFGFYSMNLNAIVNPSSPFGYRWSRFLPVLPQGQGQYEGFNYLGLGFILLLIAAAGMLLRDAISKKGMNGRVALFIKQNAWLLAAMAFLTLFAGSNVISLGENSVTIPLPKSLLRLCGIFRSSGRMFFAVWYLLLLGALKALQKMISSSKAAIIAITLVCVQLLDISPVLIQKHEHIQQAAQGNFEPAIFQSGELLNIGKTHDKLLLTNNIVSRRDLAVLAGRQGMLCNAVLATGGGEYEGAWNSMMEKAPAESLSGTPDRTAVYVTDSEGISEAWQEAYRNDDSIKLLQVAEYWFLIPEQENGQGEMT